MRATYATLSTDSSRRTARQRHHRAVHRLRAEAVQVEGAVVERRMMTTYRFTAERSHQWWAIISPDVTGAATQARRLDQAEPMAREVISLLLEVPEDDIDIDLEVILDDDGQAALAMASRIRRSTPQLCGAPDHPSRVATQHPRAGRS